MSKEHLLVALDINDTSERNSKEAIELAKKLDADVTVVHAIEYIPYYPYLPYDEKKVEEDFAKDINKKLEAVKQVFSAQGIILKDCIVEKGKAFNLICETADKVKATKIVLGVGPHYLLESIIGSTADKVIRLAHQAVFLLNPYKSISGFDKILCGYDFTESSDKALETAFSVSKALNASLDVLHVIPDSVAFINSDSAAVEVAAKKKFSEKLAELNIESGAVSLHVSRGKAVPEICSFIDKNKIELLIVGTRSQNTFSRLFIGSTTEKLIRMAPCNVMTTKKDILD